MHQCWERKSGDVVPPNQLPEKPSYLLHNPWACLLNHKRKTLMCHLLHFKYVQSPSNDILLLLMDILIYSIFPMTWSCMSLLLFSTQLGFETWFLGMVPPASWVLTQWFLPLVFFLLWVKKHSSTTVSTLVPFHHILLNKIVFITKKIILDFSVKNNKIIHKVFFQQN